MSITLVAAISQNNCIGKDGALPWTIPEDLARMREITRDKVVIMGRKTWESLPKNRQPLPDRTNVVITADTNYPFPKGVEQYSTVEEAIAAHKNEEIIGFGGQKIFEEMIAFADVLDITHVKKTIEACDAFFPTIDPTIWQETWREDHGGFSFVIYHRLAKSEKATTI